MNLFSVQLLLGALLLWQAASVAGQENGPFRKTISPRDTARPLFIRVSVVNGDIRVTGGEGHDIVFEAIPRVKTAPDAKTEPLEENAASDASFAKSVTVREEENHYHFVILPNVVPVDIVLHVPRDANLKLHTRATGDIQVDKINGEIEAETFNGNIAVKAAAETVVAHTGNGSIDVSFASVRMDKPMSFTTVTGNIDLTFPANLKAKIRMDSAAGKVGSDFEIRKLPNQRNVPGSVNGKTLGLTRNKIAGQIGSNSPVPVPEVLVKSVNGSIRLQKRPKDGLADIPKM